MNYNYYSLPSHLSQQYLLHRVMLFSSVLGANCIRKTRILTAFVKCGVTALKALPFSQEDSNRNLFSLELLLMNIIIMFPCCQ